MNVEKRNWRRVLKIWWTVHPYLRKPNLKTCFVTVNILQWGEKILFKLLRKPIQTERRVQKYAKTCYKARFSTLMGRGVEETQWKKLKFLSYFWKTFLNFWEILFLSATKSHNCSWIIRGRMFSCIGNDKRLPFINLQLLRLAGLLQCSSLCSQMSTVVNAMNAHWIYTMVFQSINWGTSLKCNNG